MNKNEYSQEWYYYQTSIIDAWGYWKDHQKMCIVWKEGQFINVHFN